MRYEFDPTDFITSLDQFEKKFSYPKFALCELRLEYENGRTYLYAKNLKCRYKADKKAIDDLERLVSIALPGAGTNIAYAAASKAAKLRGYNSLGAMHEVLAAQGGGELTGFIMKAKQKQDKIAEKRLFGQRGKINQGRQRARKSLHDRIFGSGTAVKGVVKNRVGGTLIGRSLAKIKDKVHNSLFMRVLRAPLNAILKFTTTVQRYVIIGVALFLVITVVEIGLTQAYLDVLAKIDDRPAFSRQTEEQVAQHKKKKEASVGKDAYDYMRQYAKEAVDKNTENARSQSEGARDSSAEGYAESADGEHVVVGGKHAHVVTEYLDSNGSVISENEYYMPKEILTYAQMYAQKNYTYVEFLDYVMAIYQHTHDKTEAQVTGGTMYHSDDDESCDHRGTGYHNGEAWKQQMTEQASNYLQGNTSGSDFVAVVEDDGTIKTSIPEHTGKTKHGKIDVYTISATDLATLQQIGVDNLAFTGGEGTLANAVRAAVQNGTQTIYGYMGGYSIENPCAANTQTLGDRDSVSITYHATQPQPVDNNNAVGSPTINMSNNSGGTTIEDINKDLNNKPNQTSKLSNQNENKTSQTSGKITLSRKQVLCKEPDPDQWKCAGHKNVCLGHAEVVSTNYAKTVVYNDGTKKVDPESEFFNGTADVLKKVNDSIRGQAPQETNFTIGGKTIKNKRLVGYSKNKKVNQHLIKRVDMSKEKIQKSFYFQIKEYDWTATGIPVAESSFSQAGATAASEIGVYSALTQMGYSPQAACAILGNMYVESAGTFDPGIAAGVSHPGRDHAFTRDDNNYFNTAVAIGVCQWGNVPQDGNRFKAAVKWCQSQGMDPRNTDESNIVSSLNAQLAWFDHELKTSYKDVYDYLANMTDDQASIKAGTEYFERNFERARKPAMDKRTTHAIYAWEQHSNWTSSATGGALDVVSYARSFEHKLPYVWGGSSLKTGADCSHFVWLVFQSQGYQVKYRTSSQWVNVGTPVNREDLLPGDVVVYPGHVGIYAGNNMVISEHDEKTGCYEADLDETITGRHGHGRVLGFRRLSRTDQ